MATTLASKATAEAVGTALLVAVVVGSGIFAQGLSTDRGLQLLENSLATAGGLVAPHPRLRVRVRRPLNPVVSLADRLLGGLTNCEFAAYITAQMTGACAGAVIANLMFDLDPIALSTHTRSSGGLWLG